MEAARPATADDVARLAELARQGADELTPMRGGAIWSVREARPEPLEAAYLALLDRDDTHVVVGTIDEVAIGLGVGRLEQLRDGRCLGIVDELFVEPEARSIGVGEAIVDELLVFFGRHACIGVDALALPGNRATKNFFEQHGFVARAIVMHHRLDS
ncbi:MAG TPA: GNAT family N-acetyltransferase [Acidimicrobiia bacterium]